MLKGFNCKSVSKSLEESIIDGQEQKIDGGLIVGEVHAEK